MLKGKWALVTGATAGLGLAVAESLANAGANIVLHDLVEPHSARDSIRSRFGVDALSAAADLSQRPAIETLMNGLLDQTGAIDILINNAVVRHFAPVEQFAPERWEEALAVNLSAPFHLIRLALPGMKQRDWGRIVNMASIYSTRAVAIETATTGITCNALCPGTLPTPAIETRIAAAAERENLSIDDATRNYLASRQPSRRFVAMENVGATTAFLCSPAAQDITGATIPIDGGWSAA